MKIVPLAIFLLFQILQCYNCVETQVDPAQFIVWGPGLKPDKVRVPAPYFFIHAADKTGKRLENSPDVKLYAVKLHGYSPYGNCPHSLNIIDRGDGSVIVRYKIIDEWCDNARIEIKYNGSDVANSPYHVGSKVFPEKCFCPAPMTDWLQDHNCPARIEKIQWDLQPFKKVNFSAIRENLLKRYVQPESVSLCHYIVKDQEVHRKCYGKYTGFKMFMDAILLSLARVVALPDMEFYINLGDWPLSKKGGQQRTSGPYPIFSWCGSDDSHDIVLPTYDLTESTLENMGRVSLDMLSVQKQKYPWHEKVDKAFWRGRDSRRERLTLVDLSRQYPDVLNASITNFFFFRNEEDIYGPKVPIISFLDFFKYKYQVSLDGTVAAYRLPYLLAGNSLLLKQDSPYYEHFYSELVPYKHYIPFKRDLSDLIEKIQWAQDNEDRAREISQQARKFAENHLLPVDVYCYHVVLFKEWSKRLVAPIVVQPDMEKAEQEIKCSCKEAHVKDEL